MVTDAKHSEDGEDANDDAAPAFDTSTMPPFAFRENTVKLLLEMGEHERALLVIETLVRARARPSWRRPQALTFRPEGRVEWARRCKMADNDEYVPVWYLLGWAYVLMNDAEAAREPLEHALAVRRVRAPTRRRSRARGSQSRARRARAGVGGPGVVARVAAGDAAWL